MAFVIISDIQAKTNNNDNKKLKKKNRIAIKKILILMTAG